MAPRDRGRLQPSAWAGQRELAEERLEDRNERINEAEVAELRRKLEEKGRPKTSTWSFFSG